MSEPVRIRARFKGGVTDVHVLIPHPMETGLRVDDAGQLVAEHYITDVSVAVAGRSVLEARWGMAIARDPLFSFRCKTARPGDRVTVTWADNCGGRRSDETLIA